MKNTFVVTYFFIKNRKTRHGFYVILKTCYVIYFNRLEKYFLILHFTYKPKGVKIKIVSLQKRI